MNSKKAKALRRAINEKFSNKEKGISLNTQEFKKVYRFAKKNKVITKNALNS